VAIASLAEGESRIRKPLVAADTLSAAGAYRMLGSEIDTSSSDWVVRGFGGLPGAAKEAIDVGNSGTTLYIAMGSACLGYGRNVLTGDEQIRRRPVGPLVDALNGLGASVSCEPGGTPPVTVGGRMTGGSIKLDGSKTSQYLTSLLINCPLASGDTIIEVENLVEKPYVEMTLRWIEEQGIRLENDGFRTFTIPGGQRYRSFDRRIPADFSSATFFLCAAAITGADLTLVGLDMNDTQGDKAVIGMLAAMGANVERTGDGVRIVGGSRLTGGEFDLCNTPDALPAMAVTACFAEGETRLVNIAQARLKETDRIAVMREELLKMDADIDELPDGLVIRGRRLKPGVVYGHGDHRVIMALAVAGLALEGETVIESAEALDVTFPTFVELMNGIGAAVDVRE
jgi:3-phosphoshikimate 1-carboxyvinyltransferase